MDHGVGKRIAVGKLSRSQSYRQTISNGQAYIRRLTKHITTAKVADGTKISKVGYHVVERMLNRKITTPKIIDSLENPLHITSTRTDAKGPSKQYIGESATSTVNPQDEKLSTVWPTSTQRRRKYTKGGR